MYEHDESTRFLGFFALLLLIGSVIGLIVRSMQDPAFIEAVQSHSVWLADNMITISFIAGSILLIAGLFIPFKLAKKASEGKGDVMGTVGVAVLSISSLVSVVFFIAMLWNAFDVFLVN